MCGGNAYGVVVYSYVSVSSFFLHVHVYVWLYMGYGYLYRRYKYIMQIIFVRFPFYLHINRINIMLS